MESGVPPSPRQLVIPPGDVVARESTGFPRSNNEEIQKALAVIEAQFKDPMLTVNSVIEPLAYKKSAVYKLFQKECGITISKFIAKRRIRHARLMLVSTELNLDQVARSAGFSTSRQFLESFRRDIGMSPTEYRTKRASAPLAHSA